MCSYHIGNGISKRYRLDGGAAAEARKVEKVRYETKKRLGRTNRTDDSKDKENIDDDIIVFQNVQKANPNDDDNMEQEGTDEKHLDDNFDPGIPEDAEQERETDQDGSSGQGANVTDHEDFLHGSDQSSMEIDSDDGASQIGQRQVRGDPGAVSDVNDSLDQVGRSRELKPILTDRKPSAKTVILERSRPTTLLAKHRNIRRENANARASPYFTALTRSTSIRQRPWKIAKHA